MLLNNHLSLLYMQYIEFVCTANQGRSQPAALMGQRHLQELELEDSYNTRSSGSHVDDIVAGNLSDGWKRSIVKQAYDRGDVYTQSDEAAVLQALGNGHGIDFLFERACSQFEDEEHQIRNRMLVANGYALSHLRNRPEQTVPDETVVAVFCMTPRNFERVKDIYIPTTGPVVRNVPVIAVLGHYALDDPTTDIPDAFGSGHEIYEAAFNLLMDYVPKAIDRLRKEGRLQ